jgi:hypothetical protein
MQYVYGPAGAAGHGWMCEKHGETIRRFRNMTTHGRENTAIDERKGRRLYGQIQGPFRLHRLKGVECDNESRQVSL